MSVSLSPISSIVDSVASGLDSLFTSDEEREAAKLKLMKELNQPHIIQAMTNLEEAKHPSVFVSGWRPALGWLCVLLLSYAWIGRDFIEIILHYFPVCSLGESGIKSCEPISLPLIDVGELMTLVLALLGLGATRTFEKIKGVARI